MSGKVNHVPEVVIEGGFPLVSQALGILRHHLRDKVLLSSSEVTRISDGMKYQDAIVFDL
jgi:hypothetical protein